MSDMKAIGQVSISKALKEIGNGFTRNTLLKWEEMLKIELPRDERNFRVFDEYWLPYFKSLNTHLTDAGVTLEELLRWEWELDLNLPRDARGNRSLNRDWRRYLETVQDRFAMGWTVSDVIYGLKTPNQVRPQAAYAQACGPEL